MADTIVAGDPDAAEVAMRAHVRYAIEDIQAEIVRRFGSAVTGFEAMKRSKASAATTGGWRTKATVAR